MSSYKIEDLEVSYSAISSILKGGELKAFMDSLGSKYAASAGNGYGYDTKVKGSRYITLVETNTYSAKLDNLENNTLKKVLNV